MPHSRYSALFAHRAVGRIWMGCPTRVGSRSLPRPVDIVHKASFPRQAGHGATRLGLFCRREATPRVEPPRHSLWLMPLVSGPPINAIRRADGTISRKLSSRLGRGNRSTVSERRLDAPSLLLLWICDRTDGGWAHAHLRQAEQARSGRQRQRLQGRQKQNSYLGANWRTSSPADRMSLIRSMHSPA